MLAIMIGVNCLPVGSWLSKKISSTWQINANKIDLTCEFIVIQ
jgi:hypothetical protein